MLSRKEVEGIKKQYPKGTKIRLCEMEGETTVPPGTKGTVTPQEELSEKKE